MAAYEEIRAPLLVRVADDDGASSSNSEADGLKIGSHKRKGERNGLSKRLTQLDGISITVGVVVGSGIFASPGIALDQVGAVGTFLLLWVAGGILAYISALCYAELSSSMPSAGADVEYLHRAFGGAAAFAFMWAMFFVIGGGGIAIVALTFARYLVAIIFDYDIDKEPNDSSMVKAIAIAAVVLLTFINCRGVKTGSAVENVLSSSKVVLVLGAIVATVVSLVKDPWVARDNMKRPFEGTRLGGIGPGLVTVLWAFDGWNALAFMGEEMINAERDLPRGLGYGMLIVILIYVTMNVSYLCLLPARDVIRSQVVAVDSVEVVFGSVAGRAMGFFVAATVLGCANGSIMIGGRYLYASARMGLSPHIFGRIGQSSGAPYSALLLQATWVSAILFLPGATLNKLIGYFGAAAWIFYGASAATLIRLRLCEPELHRPYRVPFFPLTPLLLITVALYMVMSSVIADPMPSLAAFTFVALSYPVYWCIFKESAEAGSE